MCDCVFAYTSLPGIRYYVAFLWPVAICRGLSSADITNHSEFLWCHINHFMYLSAGNFSVREIFTELPRKWGHEPTICRIAGKRSYAFGHHERLLSAHLHLFSIVNVNLFAICIAVSLMLTRSVLWCRSQKDWTMVFRQSDRGQKCWNGMNPYLMQYCNRLLYVFPTLYSKQFWVLVVNF